MPETPQTPVETSDHLPESRQPIAINWNEFFNAEYLPNQDDFTNTVLKAQIEDPLTHEPVTYYVKWPKDSDPKTTPVIKVWLEAASAELAKIAFAGAANSKVVVRDEVGPVAIASEEIRDFRSFESILLSGSRAYKEGRMDDPDLQFLTVENLRKADIEPLFVMLFRRKDNDGTARNLGVDGKGKFANIDHGQKQYPLYSKLFGSDPTTTTQFDLACYGQQLALGRDLEEAEKEQLAQQYPKVPIAQSFTPSAAMIRNFPFQYDEKGEYQWFSYHWLTDCFRLPNVFDSNDEQPSRFLEKLLADLQADPEFQRQKYKYFLKSILLDEAMIRSIVAKHIPDQVQLKHFGEAEAAALEARGLSREQYLLDLVVQDNVEDQRQFEEVLKNMPEFQQFLVDNPTIFQEILKEYVQYNQEAKEQIIDPKKLWENFRRIVVETRDLRKTQQEQNTVSEMVHLITEIYDDSFAQKPVPSSAAGCKAAFFADKTPPRDDEYGKGVVALNQDTICESEKQVATTPMAQA